MLLNNNNYLLIQELNSGILLQVVIYWWTSDLVVLFKSILHSFMVSCYVCGGLCCNGRSQINILLKVQLITWVFILPCRDVIVYPLQVKKELLLKLLQWDHCYETFSFVLEYKGVGDLVPVCIRVFSVFKAVEGGGVWVYFRKLLIHCVSQFSTSNMSPLLLSGCVFSGTIIHLIFDELRRYFRQIV